jgi:ribosomal protein S18 acetylase RimI-like enzyme
MNAVSLHDREEICAYLNTNRFLQIYSIGDLDDFFWDYTIWYGLHDGDRLRAVILLYNGLSIPTLVLLSDDIDPLKELLNEIIGQLPKRLYAHLSPGLEDLIHSSFKAQSHGRHYKMGLLNPSMAKAADCTRAVQLGLEDGEELLRFYKRSYPGSWFDTRMLETGLFYGIRDNDKLLSVAGVHVYSKRYGVAALGNIATLPEQRGKGLGKIVTARLCQKLLENVDTIGLNVKSDNEPAIRLYKNLGFEITNTYYEYTLEIK